MTKNEHFRKLVSHAENIEISLRNLRAKHPDVFAEFDTLNKAKEIATENLKIEARLFAPISGKTVLVDSDYLHVDVVTSKQPYRYVWANAVSFWNEETISRVRKYEIDNDKVDEEIKLGLLSQEDAAKAKELLKSREPAVKIIFK